MYAFLSISFGLLLVALGTLGFVPSLTPGGLLFYLFAANFSINALYIASGAGILVAAGSSHDSLKLFFKILSILFALFAVAGLWHLGGNVFTLFANNLGRILLNALVAAGCFWLGFLEGKT